MRNFYRCLFVSVFFCLMLQPTASNARPFVDCGGGCNSYVAWSNNVHGEYTSSTVSSPTLHNSDGLWIRYIYLGDGTSNNDSIWVGMEKDASTSSGGFCSNLGAGLYYIAVWIRNGVQHTTYCNSVPSGDVNNTVTLKAGYYVSGGGGVNAFITGKGSQPCNPCSFPGADQTYSNIGFKELMNDNVSGHEVWGISSTSFKYQGLNGVWSLQGSDGTIIINGVNGLPPPQMYWHVKPSHTAGGNMYTCDYDSVLNSCTLGS